MVTAKKRLAEYFKLKIQFSPLKFIKTMFQNLSIDEIKKEASNLSEELGLNTYDITSLAKVEQTFKGKWPGMTSCERYSNSIKCAAFWGECYVNEFEGEWYFDDEHYYVHYDSSSYLQAFFIVENFYEKIDQLPFTAIFGHSIIQKKLSEPDFEINEGCIGEPID